MHYYLSKIRRKITENIAIHWHPKTPNLPVSPSLHCLLPSFALYTQWYASELFIFEILSIMKKIIKSTYQV